MRKTLHPPTTPTFEIQNQNKGIEDIMDIVSPTVPIYYLVGLFEFSVPLSQ